MSSQCSRTSTPEKQAPAASLYKAITGADPPRGQKLPAPEPLTEAMKLRLNEVDVRWVEKRLQEKATKEAELRQVRQELQRMRKNESTRQSRQKKRALDDSYHEYAEGFTLRFRPPMITYVDVFGLDEQKAAMKELIGGPLEFPDIYFGPMALPARVLCYGGPGNGKTRFAEATAGEFKITNFISLTAADILAGQVGAAARRARDLFEALRQKQPALLFIDEADSLLAARHNGSRDNAGNSDQVGVLLAELSNALEADRHVHVMVAMNRTSELDGSAPRRFPTKLQFPNPEKEDVRRIWQQTWAGCRKTTSISESDYTEILRQWSPISFDGCQTIAVQAALRACRNYTKGDPVPVITKKHLRAALCKYHEDDEGLELEQHGSSLDDHSYLSRRLPATTTRSRSSSITSRAASHTSQLQAGSSSSQKGGNGSTTGGTVVGRCMFCKKQNLNGFNLAQHLFAAHKEELDEGCRDFCVDEYRNARMAPPMDLLPLPQKKRQKK
jgi:ATP-dependent 26S proteasome regulatory subunit